MRLILIPAMECSTRTRTRASLRLRRFSPGFSAAFLGFFRLEMLPHVWGVAQKPKIAAQGRLFRVAGVHMIGQGLVMDGTGQGLARLDFGVFRPPTPPLHPIHNQVGRVPLMALMLGDLRALAFGHRVGFRCTFPFVHSRLLFNRPP